jgi:hypothetical protein
MYKLFKDIYTNQVISVIDLETGASIPFAPENTDYQLFKAQINDESAQLEDADGVLMTPDEAKAYVATLP